MSRVGVKAVEDYTFEELVEHLHDYHAMGAEAQAEDEEGNDTDPAVVARIRAMTREEALERLPYHYFMGTNTPRDSPEALASARIKHEEDTANGLFVVHYHPGKWRKTT